LENLISELNISKITLVH